MAFCGVFSGVRRLRLALGSEASKNLRSEIIGVSISLWRLPKYFD